MAIEPISIPAAAGIEYGKGDVRHFAEGDAQNVAGISNPTRHLAQRDNILAQKLNEIISVVNNQEQFVPLSIPRTAIPPNDEIVVLNQRIAPGFESRVLSASVAATPVTSDIELNVYYNEGFGGSTGTSVVTTSSEFDGGVQFYGEGEFIVTLKNKGSTSLEVAGSVLLTMRPLGAQGTLLVGSTIQGDRGEPGPSGPPGPPGPPSPGGAGTPGMVWRGVWSAVINYNANDVVSRDDGTGLISSYIALASTLNQDPLTNPAIWSYVAKGSMGASGTAGPPGANGTNAEIPVYGSVAVNGTFITGSDWTGLAIDGYNGGNSLPSTAYPVSLNEVSIVSSAGAPKGFATLTGMYRIAAVGSGTLILPKQVYGAKIDYTNAYVQVVTVSNGTVPVQIIGSGSYAPLTTSIPSTSPNDRFTVKILGSQPVMTAIVVNGVQPLF